VNEPAEWTKEVKDLLDEARSLERESRVFGKRANLLATPGKPFPPGTDPLVESLFWRSVANEKAHESLERVVTAQSLLVRSLGRDSNERRALLEGQQKLFQDLKERVAFLEGMTLPAGPGEDEEEA
jgi:hypothetical protein